MSNQIQKLSIVAGLLAAAIGTTAEAGIINVGTGSTFSYNCSLGSMLTDSDTNFNLLVDGTCLRNNGSNGNSNVVTSFIAWQFETGTGRTFDSNIKMTGRFDDWMSPATKVTEKVLVSTTGDYSTLANGTFTGWTTFYSGSNSTQAWNDASIDGYYTAGSTKLFVAYVVFQNTGGSETWLSRYFQDSNFALSGNLAAVPEPASLALLGLMAVGVLHRRRR